MKNKLLTVMALAGILCMGAQADLSAYSQDFEGLIQADPGALAADGWLIFGNVFDSGGAYLYGYGVFGAPNDGGGFSQIAIGEGGPAQGNQQLNVFSDYNNGDHGAGNLIEANVFQEQAFIAAADVGNTVTFTFDAKRANLAGATTALAFIKTLDPNAGYATTNFETVDMTTIPQEWGDYSVDLLIDSSLVGQILQFGFSSTASNYEGSGVIYDNVNVAIPEPATLSLLGLAGAGLYIRRRFMS